MNSFPLISVIVPVFNAQSTLERTLKSFRLQTYQRIELIFVNDCSTDKSPEMLAHFATAIDATSGMYCKVISHSCNQGVSAARNTGLDHATGEFVCYVDADDFIGIDAIELCVQRFLHSGADIIYFHWWLSFNSNARRMQQPFCAHPLEAINAMLAGTMRWNLWLFMVRRELYEVNNIRFIPNANMGEDLLVTIKLFVQAGTISLVDHALYHYKQDNAESLTKTYSLQHMREVEINVNAVTDYLNRSKYRNEVGLGIDFLKLNIKLPLLVTGRKGDYIRWTSWFTESDKYVLKNRTLPLRTRLLQWCAWKRQYWVLKIYHTIILRFIYGTLYK